MDAEREMTLQEWCECLHPQHRVNREYAALLDTIATLSAEVERLTEELSDARASIAAMESVQSDALDRATDRIIASQAAIAAGTKGPEGLS